MRVRRTSSCRTLRAASVAACSSRLTATGPIWKLWKRRSAWTSTYAMLQKMYGAEPGSETRYSPAVCIGCKQENITGSPDPKHISTSYVERQNLTMRMSMRRFTRLTNAFSKKVENHAAAIALYFMYYNFGRVHQTLRVTPAMEAGVSTHVWSIEEIVHLLD